jgi:hypothetical protein
MFRLEAARIEDEGRRWALGRLIVLDTSAIIIHGPLTSHPEWTNLWGQVNSNFRTDSTALPRILTRDTATQIGLVVAGRVIGEGLPTR